MNRDELESLDKPALIDLLVRVLSRIEALEAEVGSLKSENAALRAENAQLKERLAKLERPAKTPDNSSLPPSKGQKANRPDPGGKKQRKGRKGVARALAETPDEVVDCKVATCRHCEHVLPPEGQKLVHEYDHVDIPPVMARTTRVRIFACRCPHCGRKARGVPPEGMEPGTPFGRGCTPLPLTCITITP